MGKQVKAKSESAVIVIKTSPKQDAATVKILDLAPKYGVKIFKAPLVVNGEIKSEGQRAVQKAFPSGDPSKPDVRFSMWANKENGERVLAVLKPEGTLSIKPATAAIHTVKA